MSSLSRVYKTIQTRNFRVALLLGIIAFVFLYYLDLLNRKGTIEQGIVDWGIDMGYTMLFWGILLVAICLFFIIYPKQHIFRDRNITRTHAIVFGSIIFFVVIGAAVFSWMAHDPTLNFYHNVNLAPGIMDKIAHVIVSFGLTLVVLTISPKRSTALLIFMIFGIFELIEILVIYNFEGTIFDITSTQTLMEEIADVPLDMIANTIGWLLAIFMVVIVFKRKFRR